VVYPLMCAETVCPQPPEPQACCLEDGTCVVVLPDECLGQGGTVYPDLTCDTVVCPQPPEMACCLADGSCVSVFSQTECDALAGVLYADVTCTTPGFTCPQPVAACCFDFDNNCYMQTEADCVAAGGTWYVGMDCASFTCPFWAVCCVGEVCHITTRLAARTLVVSSTPPGSRAIRILARSYLRIRRAGRHQVHLPVIRSEGRFRLLGGAARQ